MIYLDYSATTKTDEEVLDTFNKANQKYFANPNSHHKAGLEAKKLIDSSTEQIASILGVKSQEIIYTSGASEANNLAIKGIALKYQNRGKHIITSELEHSSIYAPLNYLASQGFDIDIVPCDKDGKIDLEEFSKLLRDDTILVTLTAVSSETGVIEPIDQVAKILENYPKCFFHVDMTQAIGKMKVDLSKVDLASFSAHKFFGIKGIGALYKKEKIIIEPQIHGGSSTTIFRSGTPATAMIASLSKALRLVVEDQDKKFKHVKELNEKIRKELSNYEFITVNSPSDSLSHILNISFLHSKPETILHMFEEEEIYISTQTACSSKDTLSKAVLAVTGNMNQAETSVRISLSHKTSEKEVEEFLKVLAKIYDKVEALKR